MTPFSIFSKILSLIRKIAKLLFIIVISFGVFSAFLYFLTTPQKNRNWTSEHQKLPSIVFDSESKINPSISINNLRDFKWYSQNGITQKEIQYKTIQFKLESIISLKAVVSHFSAISEIAHVFMIVVLDDGREFGVSIEARREENEAFSIQGGLLAHFELMYVLATPADLLGIRKINNEATHVYPIKVTKNKAQELFRLIAHDVNSLTKTPELYHLFFKNCTNQLVKHVSILTERKYPWFFQTLAPGNTGKTLFDLDLIDLPDMSFEEIQTKTLIH